LLTAEQEVMRDLKWNCCNVYFLFLFWSEQKRELFPLVSSLEALGYFHYNFT